jgi:hypothetical protein
MNPPPHPACNPSMLGLCRQPFHSISWVMYGCTDLRGSPAERGRDGRGSRNQIIAGSRHSPLATAWSWGTPRGILTHLERPRQILRLYSSRRWARGRPSRPPTTAGTPATSREPSSTIMYSTSSTSHTRPPLRSPPRPCSLLIEVTPRRTQGRSPGLLRYSRLHIRPHFLASWAALSLCASL